MVVKGLTSRLAHEQCCERPASLHIHLERVTGLHRHYAVKGLPACTTGTAGAVRAWLIVRTHCPYATPVWFLGIGTLKIRIPSRTRHGPPESRSSPPPHFLHPSQSITLIPSPRCGPRSPGGNRPRATHTGHPYVCFLSLGGLAGRCCLSV